MSFTTVSVRTLKLNYLAALMAGIVALVAAVTIVTLQGGGSGGSTSAPVPAVRSIPVSDAGPPTMVWYLVGSQEEAAWIRSAEAQLVEAGAAYPGPARYVHVMVASTPEEEAEALNLVNLASPELAEAGTTFSFYDLRSR